MDYEEYLVESYIPVKAIEVLSDIIYEKSNNDWNIFSQMTREHGDELLAINYAINILAKQILSLRQKEIDNIS